MGNYTFIQQVKNLHLPIGAYALFGSAPLAVRGLRDCRDIDIIVTEKIWDAYKNGGWEVRGTPQGSMYVMQGNIELWRDWYPGEWDVEKLIHDAEIIDGLPFVRLATVLQWKKLRGNEKDLQDIKLIEKFLCAS